jgi:hypothetical protein
VQKPRERQLRRPGPATDRRLSLVESNAKSGAREDDRGSQPIRARAHDDRIDA